MCALLPLLFWWRSIVDADYFTYVHLGCEFYAFEVCLGPLRSRNSWLCFTLCFLFRVPVIHLLQNLRVARCRAGFVALRSSWMVLQKDDEGMHLYFCRRRDKVLNLRVIPRSIPRRCGG